MHSEHTASPSETKVAAAAAKSVAPRVTLVVPVHNTAAFLPAFLESLRASQERDLEILVVDDGSTDESPEILKHAAAEDDRIQIFRQDCAGVSTARNLGLRHASGEWVAFADSDDWLDPEFVSHRLAIAEKCGCEILIGNAFAFSGKIPDAAKRRVLVAQEPSEGCVSGRDWIVDCVRRGRWPHYVWLQLMRREFLLRNNLTFEEGIFHEDVLWTTRLALAARAICIDNRPLYGYRKNPGSITGSENPLSVYRRAKSYLRILASLREEAKRAGGDPVLRNALWRQANREAGHFFGLVRKKPMDAKHRVEVAKEFLAQRLLTTLLLGAGNFREVWRALRCHFIMLAVLLRRGK